jgi:microcystin-dependent protein
MRHGKSLALAASGIAMASASPAAAQVFFLGQIIEVGNTFCPRGTADAAGQLLSIQQNAALFSLLGTTYGGNGVTTFALPDIRGRMVIGDGNGFNTGLGIFTQGQVSGQQTVTLTVLNLPSHTHVGVFQTIDGNTNDNKPFRNSFGVTPDNQYKTPPPSGPASFDGALHADTMAVQKTGTDGVPFNNMSPFLVTRSCIMLSGIFPSRN